MNHRKEAKMLEAFQAFASRIVVRYSYVSDCLEARRYEEAHILLAELAQSHAKTSLSLRNFMIRQGLIEEGK